MGTALAALVLTLLTFGPSFDALICHDEASVAASAAQQPLAAATGGAEAPVHGDDALGVCAHGHCHHGGAYVPVDEPPAAEPVAPVTAARLLARDRVPTADRKFDLIRPPRA